MGEETRSIKLAQVPPFRLGEVLVDPPRRRVSRDHRAVILEPRVMQVLVLLAKARGAVISRDELIERCWGGRIVGENAINRVISRIRQLAAELGVDSFLLETITKVGYRMVVMGEAEAVGVPDLSPPWPVGNREPPPMALADVEENDQPTPPRLTRRRFVAAGAALAGLGAAGTWLWRGRQGHVPHPRALEFHRRGQLAQRQGVPEQVRQAISFFRQATEIDPLYADAWGGLALSYRHVLEGYADGELDSLPGLIESAANRALALDSGNADAATALAMIDPYFRNWARIERDLLRIARDHPDHWFVQGQLGLIRYETGRWRDGLPHTERQLEIEPFIPIPHVSHARALWGVGRLHEAETALDAAVARWPGNFLPWNLKFSFLLFNRRPAAAAAFVMNPEMRPEQLREDGIQARLVLARAVERGDPADIAASLADQRAMLPSIGSMPMTAPVLVLLGQPDLAMAAMERYFLGGAASEIGPAIAPPTRYERRYTHFLFMPNMARLWPEPRFAALLESIGLEPYWRATGTVPDHRRTA
ncbi:MAG: winged helix-turn-helix domain-containing protein [Sphingomonas sp.]|nr:winged helix-turn-helix domain-containing protein [Sphingomonas sp.]